MAIVPIVDPELEYPDSGDDGGPTRLQLSNGLNLTPDALPWTSFDRYYSVYMEYEKDIEYQYVFFVRPQLNLVEAGTRAPSRNNALGIDVGRLPSPKLNAQTQKNPVIAMIAATHGECIYNLIKDGFSHHFIPYFTSRTESIQIPDFSIKTYSISQPYSGYQMPFAGHGIESTTGGSFDVTFRDDGAHRIANSIRVWLEYINCVTLGTMDPIVHTNTTNRNIGPIANNYFDYMGSIYTISTKADGREIVWFDKFTGILPTGIPDSNHSFNRGSINNDNQISIPFQYFHHKACDLAILGDFNYNAYGGVDTQNWGSVSSYNWKYGGVGNGIVGTPFITYDNTYKKLYLNWHQ